MSEQLAELLALLPSGPEVAASPALPEARLFVVQEAVRRLGWGTMTYQCDQCRFEWEVWLTLGVEGPSALREEGIFIAAPFVLSRCPAWPVRHDATPEDRARYAHLTDCGGHMQHVRFAEDREFLPPRLIPDDAPRFVLPRAVWRGDHGAELELPEPALVRARRFHSDQEEAGNA